MRGGVLGEITGLDAQRAEPVTVSAWEVATGKKRRQFTFHRGEGSSEPEIAVNNLGRPVVANAMAGAGSLLRFAPRGKQLVLGGRNTCYLFDALKGEEIRRFGGPRVFSGSAVFSPDGRYLAAGSHDGQIYFWDVATGTVVSRTPGHRSTINRLAFSADGKTLVSGSADTTGLIWDVATLLARRGPLAPAAQPEDRLTALWDQLGAGDAEKADQAMQALTAAPQDAVAFLQKRLKPETVKLAPGDVDRLIKDLDSNDFATREKAMKSLEKLERATEAALRKALAGPQPSLELRRRMERLLERLDAVATDPERLRGMRAVEVLEDIGTPEARTVLEGLAKGTPGFDLTRKAQGVLRRLK